ncbi:MAG: (S)-ureidoglycine aminohydrolase [Verrucomicrobia bacterium]|nr:(S)-ureidoglycine aminohydrolase [Verrucomicrobiota bacterium]
MTELLGATRNVVKVRYALLTPGSLVPSQLPGWEKALCQVQISPALGARFSQVLITLERDGQCAGNTGANQYFVYVLEGAASILLDSRKHRLEVGGYAYLPAGQDVQISSGAPAARLVIFQKEYQPLRGVAKPAGFVSHEREVKTQPLRGNEDLRLQALLPAHAEFDMAVNLLTCPPGAALPAVEAPVMERGLMIVRGQGIYRLEDEWHPVQAGDAIWMAPFCPQWFVAVGKTPASCIFYQDVNRDPM